MSGMGQEVGGTLKRRGYTYTWASHVAQCLGTHLPSRRPGFNPGVGKIPQRREWQPTPVFLPRKFHGWRSLVGYSPCGHKESDTTEQLNSSNNNRADSLPCEAETNTAS